MNKELEDRLLETKARLTLNKIIDLVKEKDNKKIVIEYALEKFENYVRRFDISVSDKEVDYLTVMRVRMHDGNGLAPKNMLPKNKEKDIPVNNVMVVDFTNKKRIKPN